MSQDRRCRPEAWQVYGTPVRRIVWVHAAVTQKVGPVAILSANSGP